MHLSHYTKEDKPSGLTEDKIRDTVREVFFAKPAPIIYYTSPAGIEAFDKAMKESLVAQGFKFDK